MKKSIYLLLLFFPLMVLGQNPSQNYKKTKTYKKPSTGTITANDTLVSVSYMDGLGRPMQTVAVKAGGTGKDIVVPVVYEPGGRQTKQYLPYVNTSQTISSPNYRDNTTLIPSLDAYYVSKFPADLSATAPNPYSEVLIEQSPLGRTLQVAAPGSDWSMANGAHTQKIAYDTNVGGYYTGDAVFNFTVGFTDGNTEAPYLGVSGFYPTASLYKKIVKNENWTAADGRNKTTEEFTDKNGKLILKRNYNAGQQHDTYYVYDKFGNLTFVIPPLAADDIVVVTNNFVNSGRNFPWTRMALVDQKLADDYDTELSAYDNEAILNLDLVDRYGGQGGFTVNSDADGYVTLTLNITVSDTLHLRTGIIADISDLGPVRNQEIGKIEGFGYSYYFLVNEGNLEITGKGTLPMLNLNATLAGGTPLTYHKNYPWTRLAVADPLVAAGYEDDIAALDNSQILTTYTANTYGAQGGIAIGIDDEDTVTVSLNISSTTALELQTGALFPLDIYRRIPDRVLGTVAGTYNSTAYSYTLSIENNTLHVTGSGYFTSLNFVDSRRSSPTYDINQTILEGLCYMYHYDKRDRIVEKKVPGKGWEHIVYDRLDRVVLTQDANLRSSHYWLFTKYDTYNRVICTGQITDTRVRDSIQNYVDDVATNPTLSESRSATGTTSPIQGLTKVNYTNTAFPTYMLTFYTISYYDDYNFDMPGLSVPTANYYGTTVTTNTKGLATGSRIRALTTATWSNTLTGYDGKARPVWSDNKNGYLGTEDISHIELDFMGTIQNTRTTHKKTGLPDLTTSDHFDYDPMGRLLKQSQTVGSNPAQLIAYNEYDELGQVRSKKMGDAYNSASNYNATTGLQEIDYAYNIRGWLTNINDVTNYRPARPALFALSIKYNTGASPLYNGNIAETSWRSKTDNFLRSYNYEYDDLNRLTSANYLGNYTLTQFPTQTENYKEGPITYDKNGNIKTLERYGLKANNTVDKIDVLSYSYFEYSNQLRGVNDTADTNGFNNGTTGTNDDYSYDANGNLKKDLNKGYGKIANYETTYNHLDLPLRVKFSSTKYINYVYDATGVKLEKKVTDGPNITTTQYDGGYVYKDNVLQYFPHPEGYASVGAPTTTNGVTSYSNFEYIYQYKDHLGNVRLSYLKDAATGNLQVVEEENYYAFGMKHSGYNNAITGLGNTEAQKIEYNSKEYQSELAFNMYDYGARNYDATLGRWMNIDPLAEISRRWSPYNYCYNNPVVFVDRDGMKATYNWGTGKYMDGGREVSFDAAMASNGVNFTPVDPDSGNMVYQATKKAYDAMVATANGGGPGGGFWDWLFGRKSHSTVTVEVMEPATILADDVAFTPLEIEISEALVSGLSVAGGLTSLLFLTTADTPDFSYTSYSREGSFTTSDIKTLTKVRDYEDNEGIDGSYTIMYSNGKKYHGKGPITRMMGSAIARMVLGFRVTSLDWTPAPNAREAFKAEYRRMQTDRTVDFPEGYRNPINYNIIQSPGKAYIQQDGY